MRAHYKVWALRTLMVVAALVVSCVAALLLVDWNVLKRPIQKMASAGLGREVTIGGDIHAHIWSRTPTLLISGLTVGNPSWESGERPLARIEKLEIGWAYLPLLKGQIVLPRISVLNPEIYLHRDRMGRANWTSENTAPSDAPASKPSKLPVMRDLLIENGKLVMVDEIRRLTVNGSIQARDRAQNDEDKPFKINGKGAINGEPFELTVAGGSLIGLDESHPYPFFLHLKAGDIEASADGRVVKPFDLGGVELDVKASGKDLAEGFYLTQLALPNTAPFHLQAHIVRDGQRFVVSAIDGQVGDSDLKGHLEVDATRKRPFMTGELSSERLRLKDLAASLGEKEQAGGSLDAQAPSDANATPVKHASSAPSAASNRLFPDAHLQVDRVRGMDADVSYHAGSVESGSVPFTQVSFAIKLEQGVLRLAPFSLTMTQGQVDGVATIDARADVPKVHVDVHVKNIELAQFKGKKPGAKPPLEGVMQARGVIDGRGDSVHRVVSTADGTLTVVLPNGYIKSALAEFTGIDVLKGVGLLLLKPGDKAEVRCGLANFSLKDGNMKTERFIVDTTNVLIKGDGDIKLGPEELDLEIKGQPKKLRLLRLRTPIELKGHLLHPSIRIDARSALKQGSIAAAIGTLLTPVSAIIAFVDTGLAKDANCAALLSDAPDQVSQP